MLNKETTGLMIVDVQGKLSEQMHESSALFVQLRLLIQGANLLELPIIWMEQLPDKLGTTRPELREVLPGEALVKSTFSGMQEPTIAKAVKEQKISQWLVAGLEAHVCVYQTVGDLLAQKYGVHLVTDGVSSRTQANKELAIRKMHSMGAQLTSVEMALFELQKQAEGPVFKQLIQLIK